MFPSNTLLMAATKSLFAPLPAPPVGAHRRNMSVQRRFPLLHRVCKCARKIERSLIFFFGEALVSPNRVERLQKRPKHKQHTAFSVPPLLTAGTCTDCAVPSCPSVLKRWRTYSCKAISCLCLHSTKTNVEKKGEKMAKRF